MGAAKSSMQLFLLLNNYFLLLFFDMIHSQNRKSAYICMIIFKEV